MNLLLDTHVVLWWLGDQRLTDAAYTAIATPDNAVFVSAASAWEIGVKKAPKGSTKAPAPSPQKGTFAAPPKTKTMGFGFGGGVLGGVALLGLIALVSRRKN